MRTLGCLFGALVFASSTFGCGSDCENTATCSGAVPDASTGGASGDSGLGGTSGTSGTGGTSGAGGTGGTGGDAATCDTTKSPSEEACLVADDHAIFVSPTGSDSADGSKGAPVQSWEKALELSKAEGKFVVACNDDFTSPVALTGAHGGSKLYGGFKCSDWTYDSAKKTKLAPSAAGVALSLDSVVGFHAEDVIVEAKDATTPGASSIAVFAKGSSSITLTRVDVIAGKGAAGANGVVTPFTYPKQTDLNGNSASLVTGGGAKLCNCPGAKTTTGGIGGSAPSQGGGLGLPDHGGGQGGVSASPDCAVGNGLGKSGAPAPLTPAAPGATTLGTLTASGWTPSGGSDGVTGSPGQGGGGGASTATSGGGGGGCGGCGGAAGPGGKGGGSSIALLLLDTPITLDATVTLTSKDAGKGGNGAAGQAAQSEVGFGGIQAVGACPGGNGGLGASGGAGGGAAGGISAGIVWKGAPTMTPVVDGSTAVTLGGKGAKGTGSKSNDGIDGVAQDVVEVK